MSSRVLVSFRDPTRIGPYRDALVAAGLTPVLTLPSAGISLQDFDGLLLTGGTDVDPARYTEPKHAETQEPDVERDGVELSLVKDALDRDLPILAICRGLQLLNVYHGGTLMQHIEPPERHRIIQPDKSLAAHTVSIAENTTLAGIAGESAWEVNSRHHQAVKSVGDGLRVSAVDPRDGVIEGLERPDRRFVVAVQWHPEDQIVRYPEQLRLFRAFGAAMAPSTAGAA